MESASARPKPVGRCRSRCRARAAATRSRRRRRARSAMWRLALAGGENGLADQPGALVALLGRLVAEGQADVVLAAAVGVEGGAGRVLHARLHGVLRERLGIGPRGQPDPEEEAALRTADDRVGVLQLLV